jgi:glucosyl-3-phosphoglycerate synthase
VSVCIPARNEAGSVASVVSVIVEDLMRTTCIVDELIVLDDYSTDDTASVAAAAGATVVRSSGLLSDVEGPGKGQAMWKALQASSGEFVVYCDADVVNFDAGFVLGLLGPLLVRDDVAFVKGFYDRPLDGAATGGGRVTELMARPLITVLYPHLGDLAQPLSGECAARRDVLEAVPFAGGYAVDLGLLIDVTARFGNTSLVQCDLGSRVHRNRPLSQLGPQALAVLQLALARSSPTSLPEIGPGCAHFLSMPGVEPALVELVELPAVSQVPASRLTA